MHSLGFTKVCGVSDTNKALESERKEEGYGGERLHVAARLRMQTVSVVYTLLRLTGSAAAPLPLAGSHIVP